jgi:hypothetical protein
MLYSALFNIFPSISFHQEEFKQIVTDHNADLVQGSGSVSPEQKLLMKSLLSLLLIQCPKKVRFLSALREMLQLKPLLKLTYLPIYHSSQGQHTFPSSHPSQYYSQEYVPHSVRAYNCSVNSRSWPHTIYQDCLGQTTPSEKSSESREISTEPSLRYVLFP